MGQMADAKSMARREVSVGKVSPESADAARIDDFELGAKRGLQQALSQVTGADGKSKRSASAQ